MHLTDRAHQPWHADVSSLLSGLVLKTLFFESPPKTHRNHHKGRNPSATEVV